MELSLIPSKVSAAEPELAAALRHRIRGEVRFDALSRTLYATDASIYEIIPAGVVLPACVEDVVATLAECRAAGVSIIARGGGTGLTGGAVGPGVQIDFSRFMTRIGALDVAARTVEVEPGVVLDDLNAFLLPHGLHFAPDVATASRATLGGMIANNSCGAHSIVYGRTVDHVAELTVVLADGNIVTFGEHGTVSARPDRAGHDRACEIEKSLSAIRDDHDEEIARRFPKVLRSNGGYGLDRLGRKGTPADAIKILCGSEGTLAIIVGAKLKLVPLPAHKAVVVLHYRSVPEALGVTPAILRHNPSAVELVDRLILDAGRANVALGKRCDFLKGDPSAVLAVEFFGTSETQIAESIRKLISDPELSSVCLTAAEVYEPKRQADVWNLRKAGLGLLMSRPGDAQPQAFVEDSAVDPSRLREYILRFTELLDREGLTASYYAHASVGCLHVRPVVNLKDPVDVARMKRVADGVSDLALEFGGAMTGEHGDGILRSCWLEKMYGPRIIEAFRQIKTLFDPDNLLNPHKIVDPWPMTEHLRHTPSPPLAVKTYLDFEAYGGMAGLAGMCSGVGQCRQKLVGTMCPSYMATLDETHTTRARGNALRAALSQRGLLHGLDDARLAEVMDLCLLCKACKTECPTGTDMARLKSEYLAQQILVHGVSRQARFIAGMPDLARRASHIPRLANAVMRSRPARIIAERRYGLDRRIAPPQLATQSFRRWYRGHRRRRTNQAAPRGPVVFFVDTWTNYYTPRVGIAAVRLLERAGFQVYAPRLFCCGRPAISKGLLAEARALAEANVALLAGLVAAGVPILGVEPSCLLTLTDEYPQLVRTPAARRIASQTMLVETLLRRVWEEPGNTPLGADRHRRVLYHGHCHQKAMVGTDDTRALLQLAFGSGATEINSGCCGMAGSFGHEKAHYDVARAIGEQRLFPAVRGRGDAEIAISGFSCRCQIEHHTDARPRHWIELVEEALPGDDMIVR